MHVAQNTSIHKTMVLLPRPLGTSRRMAIFTYLQVKPMFVVQVVAKQPFSCVIIGASITLANPP
jgi:hypothetical protein